MKHLNQEERETVPLNLNLVTKDKWIELYKELWYDLNVPQEAEEKVREDTGVDAITIDE